MTSESHHEPMSELEGWPDNRMLVKCNFPPLGQHWAGGRFYYRPTSEHDVDAMPQGTLG